MKDDLLSDDIDGCEGPPTSAMDPKVDDERPPDVDWRALSCESLALSPELMSVAGDGTALLDSNEDAERAVGSPPRSEEDVGVD